MLSSIQAIADFGEHWDNFRDNGGFYGSIDQFRDICGDLLPVVEIQGRNCVEVRSGTGRIVNMLIALRAEKVCAVEPSRKAFDVLKLNTRENNKKTTTYLHQTRELFI